MAVAADSRSTTPSDPVLLWLRQDLRLLDNPALVAAANTGRPVIPLFILEEPISWPWGGASKWWLHHSLARFTESLRARGWPLVLRRGDPLKVLPELIRETGAREVHWNRRYEPEAASRDEQLGLAVTGAGCRVHDHEASLMAPPEALKTGQGGPYQVFTPYYKKFTGTRMVPDPLPEPAAFRPPESIPGSLDLAELGLLPRVDWTAGLVATWTPGEAAAQESWRQFREQGLTSYGEYRDLPAVSGTSRLSAHLHWGEISPRQLWHEGHARGPAAGEFLRQVVWREFAHHLLHHFPETPIEPLKGKFAAFPWDGDPGLLSAWQTGQTGYPLVDAGMRQLWHTGWMHNRVRMVAASFLVKHLLLPWQEGARWFWDTLVDASLANNTFGWQWVAGCGADAAPYFRIFNPIAQGKRFDPRGAYIRRWVPELASLPDKLVHEPWLGPPEALDKLGVKLGVDYPWPVVDHAQARARALASYQRMQAG